MKILVSEYVLSLFDSSRRNYFDLLPEAYAMTTTIAQSLIAAGCEVYLTVSSKTPGIPWGNTITVNNEDEYYYWLKHAKKYFDWVILIAPPVELTMLSEILGEKLLGPPFNLVKIFSDKSSTVNALEECSVKTPRTMLVEDTTSISGKLSELNPPYVVKPTLLAGSECVYFAENESNAQRLVREAIKCDPSGRALIQEYINGVHGSISVINGENNYLFYSLNLQLILLSGSRLRYIGGVLPTRITTLKEKAEIVLNKLSKCYPMLRGYIGLDIVWTGEDIYVVEVNPRPTTSIIGIYELFPRLGECLVESTLKHSSKSEQLFLGDMVRDYAYYIILSEPTQLLGNEKIISIEGSRKSILVGRSSSKNSVLNRVSELLPINNLTYDLAHSLQ